MSSSMSAMFGAGFAAGRGVCRRALVEVTAAGARAEHLHATGADLGRVALVAFLVGPFARRQPPFDIESRAFLQGLAGYPGHPVEKDDPMDRQPVAGLTNDAVTQSASADVTAHWPSRIDA